MQYRPEIDGLRAIAVVSVILYHAQITVSGFQPFQGGFLGVDIFFVISGYLITSIILKELISTGTFSFKFFYERRIRRIIPTLLFVMLLSLPFVWMYLLPNNLIDFSKSILFSLGFSSNLYFHYSGEVYGAESGLLKPFLHTWSLSVEEQFYIFFPIFLVIIFKFFKRYTFHILFIGLIISFAIADWTSRNYQSMSFYFIHTRAWELLAGSILGYFELKFKKRKTKNKLDLILPSFGFFLICISILFFNEKIVHPSIITTIPIIGTSIIIWFSNKKEIVTILLSSKIMVGIGLISYSLYLWHYPIFVFDRIILFTDGDEIRKIYLAILIFILATLSYFLVEKNFRNKKFNFRYIVIILLFIIFSILILIFFTLSNDGFKNRYPKIFLKNFTVESNWNILAHPDNQEFDCHESKITRCAFNKSSNKKVYIIGDSHMGTLIFDLKNKLVNKNYQFVVSTYNNCLYFPGFSLFDIQNNLIFKNCSENYFNKLKEDISQEKEAIIIFGGRFPLHLSQKYFDNLEGGTDGNEWPYEYRSNGIYNSIEDSFFNEIKNLSKKNKIILVYPIPEVGWYVPYKLLQMNKKNSFSLINKNFNIENFISTSYEVFMNRAKYTYQLFDSLENSNIFRVKPAELFCNKLIVQRCATHDYENIFYADDSHPSLKGAEMINDLIIKEIEKIELSIN